MNVAGIPISHPDRVVAEAAQLNKGQLAEYYHAVSRFMLPGIVDRPLSLLRCPEGVGKQCFYQRNVGRGLGKDVRSFDFRHKGNRYQYLYIEDERGLIELVQMGAIEIHPWGARVDAIDTPDRMIFDLDPAPDVPFEAVKIAARDIRRRLQRHGLKSNLRCSGGKGLHIWVPLKPRAEWAEVKQFASSIAHEMVEAAPDAYIATMTKAKRTGRIFIDFFRNDYTATAIADYAVRTKPNAPVAVPLDWTELDGLKSPDQFSVPDVLKRMTRKRTDPSAKVPPQTL